MAVTTLMVSRFPIKDLGVNIDLIQKQPSFKKVCGPQGCCCEKKVKSKVAAKKWL